MTTKTLHFSIDKSFPVLIGNIAQEHLVYNLDIEKAVNTYIDSFSMSRELAIMLLHGKDYVLRMEDDNETVYMTEREDSDEYPMINCKDVIRWFLEDLSRESSILSECIKNIQNKDNTFDASYSFEELYYFIYGAKHTSEFADDLMNRIKLKINNDSYYDCDVDFSNFVQSLEYIKQWKETAYKKFKVIKFMIDNNWISPKEINELVCNEISMKEVLEEYYYICNAYNDITRTEISDDIVKEFMNFVTSMNNIANAVDVIQPITPSVKKDAYWLSPEGELYGMNGDYNSMVHLQIADALINAGIIEVEDNRFVDSYLEEHGWCKIHHNWILFDPYVPMKTAGRPVPIKYLTEEQVKVIAEYLKNHCNGFGKFGYKHTQVSFVTFKAMDDIKRTELFCY